MTMKRTVAFILALFTVCALVIGCNKGTEPPNDSQGDATSDMQKDEPSQSANDNQDPTEPTPNTSMPLESATQDPVTEPLITEPPVTQPPTTQSPVTQPPTTQPPTTQPPTTQPPTTQPPADDVIPLAGQITLADGFSEGLAFVRLKGKTGLHCINEKGKVVYSLPESCKGSNGYVNGYALIASEEGAFIVDKKGNKVVSPQTHGYTDVFPPAMKLSKILKDGYLPVYKDTTDYTGRSYQFGILSLSGQWILPLSNLAEIDAYMGGDTIGVFDDYCYATYENGYLCICSDYMDYYNAVFWNMRDGSFASEIADSQVWTDRYENGCFYDNNGNVRLEIDDAVHGSHGGYFTADAKYAYFYFGTGFLTLIDRQGNFQFDPIPALDPSRGPNFSLNEEKNYFLITSKNGKSVYDLKGKLKFTLDLNNVSGVDTDNVSMWGLSYDGKWFYGIIYTKQGSSSTYFYLDQYGNRVLG